MGALETTDLELMIRVKGGEVDCMAPLLDAHRMRIVHFLHRMVQNQAVAEELAQEVFLRVYRARARYEPTATFTAWIYRIAANLASNWRRHRRLEGCQQSLDESLPGMRRRELKDRRPNMEQIFLDQARLAEIRDAVAELPERQRVVVLMHKYDEMEYVEIAQALGCSIPTVKSLLFRAYGALRVRLGHMAVQ